MKFQGAIEDFLGYMELERNFSKYTIRNYHKSLFRFQDIVFNNDTETEISAITPSKIRKFLRHLNSKSLKTKTIHTEMCAIRSFTKFLVTNEYSPSDPCAHVAQIKLPDRKPNPFREDEINRFFDAMDLSTVTGRRDYVIFQLALRTGLRSGEITTLKSNDINLHEALLYVRDGKGGKDRVVPISSTLCTLINEYLLDVRPTLLGTTELQALFVAMTKKPLWEDALRQKATQYARKAGLSYRQVSPHIFRYTFATLLARRSKADITVIKELLGHASILTTARYIGVVEEEKRRAVEGLDI